MRQFIGILYFLCLSLLGQAQISVKGELSTTDAIIADPVNYRLVLSIPEGATVTQVDMTLFDSVMVFTGLDTVFEKAADRFEIRDWGRWTVAENKVLSSDQLQWNKLPSQSNLQELENPITISFWDQGIYVIPPIKVSINHNGAQYSYKTNPLEIRVKTTIPDSTAVADATAIAPIKNIIEEPLKLEDFLPYILGLLGVLLFGALVYWLIKRQSKEETKETVAAPVIIRPAHEIANEKLANLKGKELWQQGEIKAYQSELTYIVREYLENRYQINALENTTDDIRKALNKLSLSGELQNDLSNILQVADLVKFAKATPDENIHDQFMQKAEHFIAATQRKVEQVESEDEA